MIIKGGNPASRREPPAMDVVEDAILLLKRAGLPAFGVYSAGTLGFLWALLYFWAYMSRNAMAAGHVREFSLLLAAAFVGMKTSHAFFFRRLMQTLEAGEAVRPSASLALKTFAAQALIQPLALFLIPCALLLTIPYPFVSAFFQNAAWVREEDGIASWLSRSVRLARLWPKQSMYLQLFLMGAGIFLTLNVVSALVCVPMALKSILGVETVFSRSPAAFLNSTFILMALALSWALADPLAKAIHAWRCFHGLARHSGSDLRIALARWQAREAGTARRKFGLAALLTALALAAPGGTAWGNTQGTGREAAHAPASVIIPDRLDALIREEMAESRYGWRQPRPADGTESDSWVLRQLQKSWHALRSGMRNFARLWSRFSDWFNHVFSKADRTGANRDAGASSPLPTRILIGLFSLTFLAAGAWLLIKRLRAVPAPVASMPSAASKLPDAAREDAKADDFPEEEWLRLMERLRAEGQHRLALRALFLAMLSLLARKGWVTVARHKSNRDYQREVAARARRSPGVAESFRENCGRFERIWYGSHALTEEDWSVSQSNFAKIRVDHA